MTILGKIPLVIWPETAHDDGMTTHCETCGRGIMLGLVGTQAIDRFTGRIITLDGTRCRVCLSQDGYEAVRIHPERLS